MAQEYKASKQRSQGRPGWAISFRHPLRNDSRGRPGLKMRRGLGTDDDVMAESLVSQMNRILSDSTWWTAVKRKEAEQSFASVIVDAFYDDIQVGRDSGLSIRDRLIPMPTREDDYSRVLLVGTTGAGKTTLLRQLIGSDPERDRFPSTSTAKTTISDIEVILRPGEYECVVTFFSEFVVQANIEECVMDACSAAWEEMKDGQIAERLLNHRDQRFRLGYVLGTWPETENIAAEDDWSFSEISSSETVAEEGDVSDRDREANGQILRNFVGHVKQITKQTVASLAGQLDENVERLSGADRDALQELLEENLQNDPAFDALVHDIRDALLDRFELVGKGEINRHRSGWPETWHFECENRDEFIDQIKWFSSNSASQFGRLLTPLVDGIRVVGPLFPTFNNSTPKLVLLDGQGLGHTPDSSSSVTTQITKRFAEVDVIVLVDNAQQPMQAAPLSVIRAVASGGYQQKLGIAFTHFDQVKGPNLPTVAEKKAHVLASVANGLAGLRDVLGVPVVRGIERVIFDNSFMLGGLDQPSNKIPRGVVAEFERLLKFFKDAITPPPPPTSYPVYSLEGLPLAVQAATRGFQRPWNARLGLGVHESVHKEHWTRIKALNRRIAGEFGIIEYAHLRPVADLVARLSEEISRFLDHPSRWDPPVVNEADADAATAQIRQAVYSALHLFVEQRLIDRSLSDWKDAYEYRGTGSTFERAREIQGIFADGAPLLSAVISGEAGVFMKEVRTLVHQAVKENGGKFEAAS